MLSENMKIKLWNGMVCAFILLLIFVACIAPGVHKRANDSINRDLWRGYSGFYNRGYETGYEDAKAGRERAPEKDFVKEWSQTKGEK